ncbi:MAG: carbohydrate kinase family protein [bacterium]
MEFAIAGTVTRDRVVAAAGDTHTSLGGILYNALALARCAEPGDVIRPIGRAGEDDRDEIAALFAACPAIDASGMRFLPGGSNAVTLTYTSDAARIETVEDRVGSLSDEELLGAARADFLLANLISGWDFTPAQIARAARGGARVLLDVQSVTLSRPLADGTRAYRAVPQWREWCAPVEVLKGNDAEISWFTGLPLAEPRDFERAADAVFECGPRVVAVTLDARGVFIAAHDGLGGRPRARARFVAAVPGVCVADTTGCGDSFASGFLAEYARTGDALRAACAGNALAALVAATRGLGPLLSLPDPAPLRERLLRELG